MAGKPTEEIDLNDIESSYFELMRAYSQSINYITINNKRFSLLAMSIAKAHIVERLDRLSEIFPMIIALNELNKDSRVITNFNRYIKDIDKMRLKFSKSSIKPRTIGAAISTAILAITTTLSGIITALGSPQFASFTNSTINILNSFPSFGSSAFSKPIFYIAFIIEIAIYIPGLIYLSSRNLSHSAFKEAKVPEKEKNIFSLIGVYLKN
jgi:hypothetical protein